jgi:para-nitrobenzyl esterase
MPEFSSPFLSSPLRLSFAPVLLSALLATGCGGGHDDPAPTSASTLAVSGSNASARISLGSLQGNVRAASLAFLGIPFGQAPVGGLRWKPPLASSAWSGTLDATRVAKHCPQPTLAAQADASEDCLFLNVYVPKTLTESSAPKPRAVMVWIYGGANAIGASDYYDPTPLVEAEDVVVVTFNYRIGALGFLAHPALDAEGHAAVNYGVMDQQLALRWVQDHISAFGGDPQNVTIFGESAGGLNVTTHLVSPKSAGLFHKAIVQSGAYQLDTPTLSASQTSGSAFATRLGCTDQTAACLRSKTLAEVLAQQGSVNTASSAFNQSTIDGTILPESQRAALTAGRINRVPVMQGSTSHEGRVFASPLTTEAVYQGTVASLAAARGKTPAEALAAYPLAAYPSAYEATAAALGDFAFACSARTANQLLADRTSVYAYEFDDANAGPLGATHGSEVGYLMKVSGGANGIGWEAAGDSLTLSKTMRRYWAQFARTGDPNGSTVPSWAPFRSSTPSIQQLSPPSPAPTPTPDFATRHLCGFWG